PTPAREETLLISLDDEPDGGIPEPELPAFPERRSQRTRLPKTRQSSTGVFQMETYAIPDWRVCDATEDASEGLKPKASESNEEERAPPPSSQRVPIFPGLSHSALLVGAPSLSLTQITPVV
ncbi:hypothetical protein CRUP_031753, partial [Coryphaenoides rupestris]